MVLASKPIASVMRLAARPVGAHSSSLTPFAERMPRRDRKHPNPLILHGLFVDGKMHCFNEINGLSLKSDRLLGRMPRKRRPDESIFPSFKHFGLTMFAISGGRSFDRGGVR
jgi:hypothetical protein